MRTGYMLLFQNAHQGVSDAEMVREEMRIAELAEPLGFDTIWSAVHCGSASNCTAVGEWDSASNNYTLAETWNGSKWVEDTTPSPGSGGHHLTALSCTPGTQVCTAVGWTGGNGPILAERN